MTPSGSMMKVTRRATPASGCRMREVGLGETLVRLAPREVDEIGVGRGADQDRVTVGEILGEVAITDDLGRAHEGEVLRPPEQDLPLAGIVLVGQRLAVGQRRHALLNRNLELGNLVANGEHRSFSSKGDVNR
jgi:hypothetical protein